MILLPLEHTEYLIKHVFISDQKRAVHYSSLHKAVIPQPRVISKNNYFREQTRTNCVIVFIFVN